MNFISYQYIVFFLFVFFLYWHLPRRHQNLLLLIASYFFYAWWSYRFVVLIAISSIFNFILGGRLYDESNIKRKRYWLTLGLIFNLGILVYFKYVNFLISNLEILMRTIGWDLSTKTLGMIVPLGISFYTFRSLSYILDVYHGRLKPAESWVTFSTYFAFFPTLIAGPIVRGNEFLFQLEKKRRFDGGDFQEGCFRILIGFFKKAFIADSIGLYLVDPVFSRPEIYASKVLWLATFAYAVQIYADFSGYSSMAIGFSRVLGFRIPENFNFPYLAKNFREFWRRWHITMSLFFRDYVYIPLGGSRKGKRRTLLNILTTTLLSGLWHGAGWTFIAWGMIHGVGIAINHLFSRKQGKEKKFISPRRQVFNILPGWLITQLIICMAWIFFRAENFEAAISYIYMLFSPYGGEMITLPPMVWVGILAFFADHAYGGFIREFLQVLPRIPVTVQAAAFSIMIVFLHHAVPQKHASFIYFQF